MSYSYVLSGERSSSGRAKRWLLAYPVAQVMCLGAAAAAAALGRGLQDLDASQALDLSTVTFATGIAVACVYGLTFGYLRGGLLRERLARFSMLLWCGAIAAVSVFFLPPAPEALPGLTSAVSNLQTAARTATPILLSGFVYGIVIGAAEALSLRRAAFGLFGWTMLSGFAWGIGHVAATAAAAFAAPVAVTAFQAGTVHAACMVLQASLAGLVMLPALRLLTPRLSYYGPKVYRSALRTRG
jgi:hypothetical protein